ncbi:unnamed protein product [Macrosiphum euphorbiae]|uniref:Uncharacterized protein n=1 Tax=Macrosiphum euphorbiae TaxID=13131 RepID=A0AAV0VY21_9HEMI|nr:unnamed protein product [Macrosiphum euphorbiae]
MENGTLQTQPTTPAQRRSLYACVQSRLPKRANFGIKPSVMHLRYKFNIILLCYDDLSIAVGTMLMMTIQLDGLQNRFHCSKQSQCLSNKNVQPRTGYCRNNNREWYTTV